MKQLIIVIIGFLPILVNGQYFELGALLGASNYSGDLTANSSTIYLNETKPAAGLFVRYNMRTWLTLRGGFNYAQIGGTDANTDNKTIRERNLSFSSNLYEFHFVGEFNVPGYEPYNYSKPFSPYLFAGLAITGFNPMADYQGTSYELRSLGTEGQGMPAFDNLYGKTLIAVPFGLGFKFALTDRINLGLELGARFALSDYLDDVGGDYVSYAELSSGNGDIAAALGNRTGEYLNSDPVIVPTGTQRGDDASNDWYYIAGLTVSYNFIENGLVGSRRRRSNSRQGCPTR